MNDIPKGYKQNAVGHLVPLERVKDIDLLRDDLVMGGVNSARNLQTMMQSFKTRMLDDIHAFMQLAAEQYDTVYGGRKGNLSLLSYDGRFKLMLAVNDSLVFGEGLHIAKKLIDECIHRWAESSNDNIRALIEHAFQTDKQGNINTARVLSLMKIDDPEWQKAMGILKDSIQIISSKSYLRLYERMGDEGKFEQIALDIAGL